MKTILLIIPYGSVGGMERLALHFYNYYKNKGYTIKVVKLISLKSDIINFNEDELNLSKKDLFELSKIKRVLFYLLSPYKLRKIIKKNNITHSIAFGDMANIFSSLTYTSEYKIGSIHALKSVELNSDSLFTKVIKWSYKSIYRNLNKVVCISSAIKTDLIENCGYSFIENLEVIYNPHDTAEIKQLSEEIIENQKEQVLFNEETVLFIGRLSMQKSPWHLVKAFNELLKTIKRSQLIFIGDGDSEVINYIKKLVNTFEISDNVHFLGRKSNPYKYLKMADVLALSSHYEGTPNVIVEAIALGVPVVSSNCTKGIVELMSLKNVDGLDENIIVESGIITPNMYKGVLGFPDSDELTKEEVQFSEALTNVLINPTFKTNLLLNQKKLLNKFDVKTSAEAYLNKKIDNKYKTWKY